MNRQEIKILILEDEEMVRINLEDYLEDEGFEVISAETGEKGLEFVRANHFDIAIVDMRLPGMDGNTFIIKAKTLQKNMQIIIHTGSTFYSLPREFRGLGITEKQILLKPLSDMGILTRTIRELMDAET